MKKYIRTTKGVYEKSKCKSAMWKIDIVQEADTIEELCDEFVINNNSCSYILDKNLTKALFNNKERLLILLETSNIYGAIWTDKGLIYVAKMNDKGELELI